MNYFQNNLKNLKLQESHRKIASIKHPSDLVPSEIAKKIVSISKPQEIADNFNNYFVNVGSVFQFRTKYPRKIFFITFFLVLLEIFSLYL